MSALVNLTEPDIRSIAQIFDPRSDKSLDRRSCARLDRQET